MPATPDLTGYSVTAAGRVVVLLALAGLFFLRARGRPPSPRFHAMTVAVLVAAALSYPNFGFLHGHGAAARHIHFWDSYHYFMGAKYLPELGYTGLYEATYVAGREMGGFEDVRIIRDLETYAFREARAVDAEAVRRRFAPERWTAFKQDVAFFALHIKQWPQPFLDRGYNDPPPRAWLLHAALRDIPATLGTLTVLTSLDYALIIAAAVALWRTFGGEPTALALAFLLAGFFPRFDYIGGTILRWDWAAALVLGVAALARGAGGAAGLLLGYAGLARLFPLLFLLPLAIKCVQARRLRPAGVPLGRTLAVSVGLVAAVSIALVASPATRPLVREYTGKIDVHRVAPSTNAVGLGALIVVNSAAWEVGRDGAVFMSEAAARAAQPASWVLALAAALYAVAALPLVLRARPLESMMYAVPLVFCVFSPSSYYYAFLVLLVLLPWTAGEPDALRFLAMGILATLSAVSQVFEIVDPNPLVTFNAAGLQLAVFWLLWLGMEYARWARRENAGRVT